MRQHLSASVLRSSQMLSRLARVALAVGSVAAADARAQAQAPSPRLDGRIVGVVRDAATGRPVQKASVNAQVIVGGRLVARRWSRIDSTGAYQLDSVAGLVRMTVGCARVRPSFGMVIASDSVALADSGVVRRDWSVTTTGCDSRPVRHVSGVFRGHYTPGFESSEFVPCLADGWFLPSDSLSTTPYDERRAWATWSPAASRHVAWPDTAPRDSYGNPQFYVRWRGTVIGPGHYGHMGVSAFEFRVDSVLEIRAAGTHDCPVR